MQKFRDDEWVRVKPETGWHFAGQLIQVKNGDQSIIAAPRHAVERYYWCMVPNYHNGRAVVIWLPESGLESTREPAPVIEEGLEVEHCACDF